MVANLSLALFLVVGILRMRYHVDNGAQQTPSRMQWRTTWHQVPTITTTISNISPHICADHNGAFEWFLMRGCRNGVAHPSLTNK